MDRLIPIHALQFGQHGGIIVPYLGLQSFLFAGHSLKKRCFEKLRIWIYYQSRYLKGIPIRFDDLDFAGSQFFRQRRVNAGGFHLCSNGRLTSFL